MARLGLYQPFIEDRNVRRLYQLKIAYREQTGRKVPMTSLVNRILDDFFDGAGDAHLLRNSPESKPADTDLPGQEEHPA